MVFTGECFHTFFDGLFVFVHGVWERVGLWWKTLMFQWRKYWILFAEKRGRLMVCGCFSFLFFNIFLFCFVFFLGISMFSPAWCRKLGFDKECLRMLVFDVECWYFNWENWSLLVIYRQCQCFIWCLMLNSGIWGRIQKTFGEHVGVCWWRFTVWWFSSGEFGKLI